MHNFLTFAKAQKQLRKTGYSRAAGDGYAAMWAEAIQTKHGGDAAKYYQYLQEFSDGTELGIRTLAMVLAKDRAKAWDVLMGIVVPS